ncbi:ABC transporter ATP-binding protein [Gracilibacillus ureilyticus]|uniref:ATP-binding cassette domain-containing protein n=1 Tax=Gracilibacillus ureilyticus TaxID=531814 RepID=UPI0015877B77|nr:ABC transporter ATP-binding protein [Gracilibacillus ureilyticus]
MSNYLLEVEQLSKSFKYFDFGPVNLKAETGTVIALVGENGSGKSTFFHLILSLLKPDKGTVTCFGQNMHENRSLLENIGYAGNNLYEVYGHLPIKRIAKLVRHWYPQWDDAKYKKMIDKYQINEKERYQNCSTGTKKKIQFIFAMVHSPKLLLLDEPFSGVDIISKRYMKGELLEFMEHPDHTIIISTHQQEEISSLCDIIWLMNRGRIIAEVEKDEINERWRRVWINKLPDMIKQHQLVIDFDEESPSLVTDNFLELEKLLVQENLTYSHQYRLELDEILAYMMEKGR